MLKRDVTFDLPLVDEVGQDTLCFVRVDVLHLVHLQCNKESIDGYLVTLRKEVHFLEEVSEDKRKTLSKRFLALQD